MALDSDSEDPLRWLKDLGYGSEGRPPLPEAINPSIVEKRARPMRVQIFENYDMLRAILARHEATIHKRWLKKTSEQRRKIILPAWSPDTMGTTHRPDFAAFYNRDPQYGSQGTLDDCAYLWPYINQEDLVKPRTLLMFMRSRADRPPAEFAAADFQATRLGRVSEAVDNPFLNEHIMIFTGRHDASSYGELKHWNDHEGGFELMASQKAPQPGIGLMILKIQAKIQSFLVACAKAILHDMAEDGLLLDAPLQRQPSPSIKPSSEGPSWATLAAEAPYRVPSHLDFSQLHTLLATKRDAAGDYIWALREDPGFYSERMRLAKEHRQECIRDVNGNEHHLFIVGREDQLWMHLLRNEIFEAHIRYGMWAELCSQMAKLEDMQRSIKVTAEDDLPEHYLMAILKLRHYLHQAMTSPIYSLKVAYPASPPMRVHFTRQPSRNAFDTKIYISSKPGMKWSPPESKALWLMGVLWEDGFNRMCLQESNIVDELQRLIDSEPTVKATISSYVAEHFADLAIICECLRQLDTYQPWAISFDHRIAVQDLQKDLDADYDRYNEPVTKYRAALAPQSTLLVDLGVPHEKLFGYPVDKRRTRINVEQMQLAEKNLDLLWAKLDKSMSKELDGLKNLRALLSEPRAIVRTAPWVDPAETTKAPKTAPVEDLVKPFSDIYLDLQYRTERTLRQDSTPRSILRTKEKTRGSSAEEPIEAIADPGAPSSPPPQTFAVDDRALKTFRMLFFIPSTSNTPGEVSWTDFLHAMTSVGFSATKMYGSAWQFQPSNLDVECSIHIHEPHPSGKIPFRVARRHGRRLHRTYGWEASAFVPKT